MQAHHTAKESLCKYLLLICLAGCLCAMLLGCGKEPVSAVLHAGDADYSLRLQIEVMFLDERTCRLRFKDVGFGEFYPASDFLVEKVLHLGGINGQFNSLS